MANSYGGIIFVGIEEQEEGALLPMNLECFRDKADINNKISKYISLGLDQDIFAFLYEDSDYKLMKNLVVRHVALQRGIK